MTKRILTFLLALSMMIGAVSISVSAAETTATDSTATGTLAGTEATTPVIDYDTMTFDEIYATTITEEGDPVIPYFSTPYIAPEEKLATMVKVYEEHGYELWYEYFTGEVALKDTRTGQIMFTNPYDISSFDSSASINVKQQLISQISITFLDNGQTKTYYSYNEAAAKSQIRLKNIKGGIRVEYTIGEESTTRLVPRVIEKSRFENLIQSKMINETVKKRMSGEGYYLLYDLSDPTISESMARKIVDTYPIAEKMAIYVFDDTQEGFLRWAEKYIKTYAPEYSYDDLEYDHELTGYVGNDKAPPMFKVALEYSLSEDGLEVRVPANGIRFDESTYQVTSISILPWMGAGHSRNTGYTFIPDGSGALIRFEDLTTSYNISGEMYGADYSYHEIVGQHAEVMRYPVFGVVSDLSSGTQGMVAIITEGDSMARLMSTHGKGMHDYNSVYASFNPRPSDTYSLSGSSVTDKSATWTVTSSRRYTGSYRIKYMFLPSEEAAAAAGLTDAYEPSYVGMAHAYRDYLESAGILTRLTADDVKDDIPVYIESFGSIETDDRFLSIPIKVDTALTTFADIKTMYDELSAEGVGNINFKLTGFANGGLDATTPYRLNWVRVLGGEEGFKDLVAYSNEKDFGLYPEFDFAYVNNDTSFDGLSLKKHAVRTIDDRYTSKRYYDAATQTWQNDFALAISPSVYEYLYTEFSSHYDAYGVNGISVSTLGTDLNSDFDRDDPYNREDSKAFTNEILAKMGENHSVMVSGGNAYTFQNADVILNMATESSKYFKSSASVPFIGMVLHGYIQTAGAAFNMESDIESALLHAIENGSGLYFILSYANTELLKDSVTYSDYYSVGYDVWKAELVEYYNTLNDVLSDLQTTLITDHEFITASRIPDADELAADEELLAELKAAAEAKREEEERKKELEKLRQDRLDALGMNDDDEDEDDADADEDEEIEEEEEEEEVKVEVPLDENWYLVDEEGNVIDPTAKYLTTEGTVVRVEYEDGTSFILNYNSFAITVNYNGTDYEIDALDFVRIDG